MKKKIFPVIIILVVALGLAGFLRLADKKPASKNEKRLLVVVTPIDFSAVEYGEVRRVADEQGWAVRTASIQSGEATAEDGSRVKVDLIIGEAKSEDFDGVVLIGGKGMEPIIGDETLQLAVRRFYAADKLVAAISNAPAILARAGVLSGRQATIKPALEAELSRGGALVRPEVVTADGKLITASQPEAATAFANKLKEVL